MLRYQGEEEQYSCARKISQPELLSDALISLFQRNLHAGTCHVTYIHFVQQCVQCTTQRANGAEAETRKGTLMLKFGLLTCLLGVGPPVNKPFIYGESTRSLPPNLTILLTQVI